MDIVDPRKLDALREIVDLQVVECAIQIPLGRTLFLESLARQFGYRLEYFKVDSWYVATAQHETVLQKLEALQHNFDWENACELDIESRFAFCALGSSAEDAAIALVLRMLDSEVDIFLAEEDIHRYYPGDFSEMLSRVGWCFEWYLRADIWFQDVPQVVSPSDIDVVTIISLR